MSSKDKAIVDSSEREESRMKLADHAVPAGLSLETDHETTTLPLKSGNSSDPDGHNFTMARRPPRGNRWGPKAEFTLWQPGIIDTLRGHIVKNGRITKEFQAAMQLSVGLLVVSLFELVRHLRVIPVDSNGRLQSLCLSAVFYCIGSIVLSADHHMGSKLGGAAALLGPVWIGATWAGALLSLSREAGTARGKPPKPPDSVYIFGCFLIWLGFIPLAALRASQNPQLIQAGVPANLLLGLVFITGEFRLPNLAMWKISVGRLLLQAGIAGGVIALAGLLVFPTLASDEMRAQIGKALLGVGSSVTGYGSRMFKLQAGLKKMVPELRRQATLEIRRRQHMAMQSAIEEEDLHKFLDRLRTSTRLPQLVNLDKIKPIQQDLTKGGGGKPKEPFVPHVKPAAKLQAILAQLRPAMASAQLEPGFLRGVPGDITPWQKTIGAITTLITRVAALEALVEGEQLLVPELLEEQFGTDLTPLFREAYGHIAAVCARLSQCIHTASPVPREGFLTELCAAIPKEQRQYDFTNWTELKKLIAKETMQCLDNYWDKLHSETHGSEGLTSKALMNPAIEVRALFFTALLTDGILTAMPGVENALRQALGSRPSKGNLQNVVVQPKLDRLMSVISKPADTNARPDLQKILKDNFGWLWRLFWTLFGWHIWARWWECYTKILPKALSSKKEFKALITDKTFQFGCKYYFVCSLVLTLAYALSLNATIRTWTPLYGFITVVVVMAEKVESAVMRAVFRVIAVFGAGGLGYITMVKDGLAKKPVALGLLLFSMAFVSGPAALHLPKMSVLLFLVTYASMVLCLYSPTIPCDITVADEQLNTCQESPSVDVWQNFLSRIAIINAGVLLVTIVSVTIFPWYTSTTAKDILGKAYKIAANTLERCYTRFYSESQHFANQVAKATADATEEKPLAKLQSFQPAKPDPQKKGSARDVAELLTRVNMMLMRDTVVWDKGFLSMPQVVKAMHRAEMVLQNRLAALEMTLQPGSFIQGKLTGAAFASVLEPMENSAQAVLGAMKKMCITADALLNDQPEASPATRAENIRQLEASIQSLEHARETAQKQFMDVRRVLHERMTSVERDARRQLYNPNDAIRLLSYLFAESKVLDKATVVARVVLQHARTAETTVWQNRWNKV